MKFNLCVSILYTVNYLFDFCVNGAVINDLYRLDIVHYNDFHDRFEETTVSYPVCLSNDTQCIGGFARLYQEVMMLLKEKPGALLLNAGDTFQGTYWYTLLKWNVTQTFINMLPNDVHAIGNHEFDDGVPGLAPYLKALQAPVVAANMDTTNEPSLNGLYKPHTIIERKGRKIGVIGLITPDTEFSSNAQGVKFTNPIAAAKKEADILTKIGVDIIILLSHCGLKIDIQIAEEVGEDIDLIVGGHSHSLLWNGEPPSHEEISGPYPIFIESNNKPGHEVVIVTASAFSKYIGNLTMYFDKNGEWHSFDGDPIFLNRSIPEDPHIKSLLQPYSDKLHSIVDTVVGYTTSSLDATPCGNGECTLGDFTADAFVDAAMQKNKSDLPTVSFLLRNMLRGSIPEGNITLGEIINTLPFGNNVVEMKIKGKYIVDTLNSCLSVFWSKEPYASPYMPQVSGLKLLANTTSQKMDSILVKNGHTYEPIEPEKEYKMVLLDFLLRKSTFFKNLRQGRDVTKLGKDADILKDYIIKKSPVTQVLDNRLMVNT